MSKTRLNICIIVFIFSCCLFFAKNASAASYYVDFASGNDSALGTDSSHPWKTINKVNSSSFLPGDNVLFNKGSVWTGETLRIPSSGTAGSQITFGAYGSGSNPVIDGGGTIDRGIVADGKSYLNISSFTLKNFTSLNAYCVELSNAAHHVNFSDMVLEDSYGGVTFSNGPHDISIDGIDISEMTYAGILWYNTDSSDVYNINIENFSVHDFNPAYSYFHGITFYWGVGGATGKPHDITIKDGSIYNLKSGSAQINAGLLFTTEDNQVAGYGVTVDNLDIYEVNGGGISIQRIEDTNHADNVIKNSRIHDNSYRAPIGGIWVSGCIGLVVEDNVIYNNHTNTHEEGPGLYFDWAPDTGTGAILSHDCTARRNVIYGQNDSENYKPLGSTYGVNSTGIAFTQGVHDIDVYQNIIRNNAEGISIYWDGSPHDFNIYNNVIVKNRIGFLKGGSGDNVKLRNNIIAFNTDYGIYNLKLWDDTSSPVDSDYNCVYDDGVSFTNNTEGSHTITQDPSFKDRNGNDYHLNGNSPCINAGELIDLISSDFDGDSIVGQIDIGAYEYHAGGNSDSDDDRDYFNRLKLSFDGKDVKDKKTSKDEVTLKFKNTSGIRYYKISHFSHFEKAKWKKMKKEIDLDINQETREEQKFFFRFKAENGDVSKTYEKKVSFDPVPYSIFNLPERGSKGEIMHQSGENFSPNSDVALYFSGFWGGYYAPIHVMTDAKGNFLLDYKINKILGWYHWYAVDMKTGTKSKAVSYLVF